MTRVLLVLLLSLPLWAQRTPIADTLLLPDGRAASGRLQVSWPAFHVGTRYVPSGTMTVPVPASGALSLSLEPTDTASPAGVSYTVRYYLQSGQTQTEYWQVPTSLTSVRVPQVRVTTVPTPNLVVALSQLAAAGARSATTYLRGDGQWATVTAAAGSVGWGSVTGSLADQLDLKAALDAKAALGHTHVLSATDITSGVFADARIAASSVTQHQASLSLLGSQISGNITGLAAGVTGIVGLANGGTGATTAAAARSALGAAALGHTHGLGDLGLTGTCDATTFVRGDGACAAPPAGGGGGGSVSSVALSLPDIFQVTGSPVTSSGTLTGSLVAQAANRVFAGPASGADAAPTFRALVAADVPQAAVTQHQAALSLLGSQLSGNITGSAANVTGTVAIANGGTGATSAAAARTALGAAASGHAHSAADTTSGTFADGRISPSSVTQHQGALAITGAQVSGNIAGNAGGVTGTVAVANGGTGATTAAAARTALGAAATSHTHGAADTTSGTFDGDRLPTPTSTKRGGVLAATCPTAGDFQRGTDTSGNPVCATPSGSTGSNPIVYNCFSAPVESLTAAGDYSTTCTIPANTLAANALVEVWASGTQTLGASGTMGVGLKIGGTVVVPAVNTSSIGSGSNGGWNYQARVFVLSAGAAGSVEGSSNTNFRAGSSGSGHMVPSSSTAGVAVDTTVSRAVGVYIGSLQATSSLVLRLLHVRVTIVP